MRVEKSLAELRGGVILENCEIDFKYLLTEYSHQVFCQEVTSELRWCLSENKSAREPFRLRCLNTGHRVHVRWFVWCKWKESACHLSNGRSSESSSLGSANSGSPLGSYVTFKAEKICLVCVKDLGKRKKQAVGELWQDGVGRGMIKQAISLSEYCLWEMKQIGERDFI